MSITLEDIKRLREIGEKATQGPWTPDNERDPDSCEYVWSWKGPHIPRGDNLAWETDCGQPGYGLSKADADFCTTARNHWNALLDLAEKSLKHSCSEDAEEAFYEATKDQGW